MSLTNATNTVLNYPSLLGEIFDFYYQPPDESTKGLGVTDRKTCLALMLTCRSFLSPALDVLWREMNNITPLFRLILGMEDRHGKLYTHEAISLHHIECFRGYARRIKYLHLDHDLRKGVLVDIDPLVLIQLQIIMNDLQESLLPGLRSLNITTRQDEDGVNMGSPYLLLFISPMLREVKVVRDGFQVEHSVETWPHRAPAFWLFFKALSGSPVPHLKTISTCLSLPRDTLANIARMTLLENISLDVEGQSNTSLQDLQLLAAIVCLKSLSFKLYESTETSAKLPFINKTFPSLQELTLHSDIQSAKQMLSIFRFPVLEKLKTHFNLRTTGNATFWSQLFVIVTNAAPNVVDLRLVRHESQIYVRDTSPPTILPLNCFLSLKPLCLTCLTMINPSIDALSNEDFFLLASTFPKLHRLNIQTRWLGVMDSSSLVTIASHLPSLSHLYLPLRLMDPVPHPPIDPSVMPQQRLKTLTFHSIAVEREFVLEPKRVYDAALLIDALFPNLQVVKGARKAHADIFKLLSDFVMGLQAARRRERDLILHTGGGARTQ